ncbi:MAG: hypothetical protein Q9217_005501 [Psora testacea]
MPNQSDPSMLCTRCREIFDGHWICRKDLATQELVADAAIPYKCIRPSLGPEHEALDEPTEFFEKPDWVKVSPANEANDALYYFSPLHHSLKGVEASAQNGCHLCTILWNKLSHLLEVNPGWDQDTMRRAVGVALIRPLFDASTSPENPRNLASFPLELSYFLDGNSCRENAFLFTIDLDIHPAANLPVASTQGFIPDAGISRFAVGHIRNWVSICLTSHSGCQPMLEANQTQPRQLQLPARFIDVSPSTDKDFVALRETKDIGPSHRYATLSHCWGKVLPVRLLYEFYEQFQVGIAIHHLPRTFQDAIHFTRALDVKYLWIDALCIIQDSQDDWLHEALLMSSVYSGSWLNLAATSSADGHGGLFRTSDPLLNLPCQVKATWQGPPFNDLVIIDESAWSRQIDQAPLNERGWVLQERVLAPRTVHFAHDQMWWDCRNFQASEVFPTGIPDHVFDLRPQLIRAFMQLRSDSEIVGSKGWLRCVEKYTQTKLTFDSDRLIAIAGVAKVVQQLLGRAEDDYLAGMWKQGLAVDLLWRVVSRKGKPESYVAPSWSWASVRGEVSFDSEAYEERVRGNNLAVKVLSSSISSTGQAMGPVNSGCIKIQGPLNRIYLSAPLPPTDSRPLLYRTLKLGSAEFHDQSSFSGSLDNGDWFHEPDLHKRKLYFSRFMTASEPSLDDQFVSRGLLLERCGGVRGQYTRGGTLHIFDATRENLTITGDDGLNVDDYLERDDAGNCIFTVV